VTDAAPKRTGRPPLRDGETSVPCTFRLSSSDYDRASALAAKHRTSVSAVIRAAFRVAVKQQRTLDEP